MMRELVCTAEMLSLSEGFQFPVLNRFIYHVLMGILLRCDTYTPTNCYWHPSDQVSGASFVFWL